MAVLPTLTTGLLKFEVKKYASTLSNTSIPTLFGVTDGKAVGTYVEQEFRDYLARKYTFLSGNSAVGIDFPELMIDVKVTSIRQPQSSCPFRDASQKVYGLGYSLLVFVYDKTDDALLRAAKLQIQHTVFIPSELTADYQTTFGILHLLENDGNVDDVDAFLQERNLPLDEIGRYALAQRIVAQPPKLGCLTISNALQWRLQYTRAITNARQGLEVGLEDLLA